MFVIICVCITHTLISLFVCMRTFQSVLVKFYSLFFLDALTVTDDVVVAFFFYYYVLLLPSLLLVFVVVYIFFIVTRIECRVKLYSVHTRCNLPAV